MERLVIVGLVVVLAVVVALVVDRRSTPDAPTQPAGSVPSQLDRGDFDHLGTPWLIVLFTSTSCRSCAAAVDMARPLATDEVAVMEVEATQRRHLHQRYGIDAVPTIVIADEHGVVQRAFLGPPSEAELTAALHEALHPGSTAMPDAGRIHRDPPA